jgi:hypothetical protein
MAEIKRAMDADLDPLAQRFRTCEVSSRAPTPSPVLLDLPDSMLSALLSFALGGTKDLRNTAACSRAYKDAAMSVANREDTLWEAEFLAGNPALHGFVTRAGDFRATFRRRLAAVAAIQTSAAWLKLPRFIRHARAHHSHRALPRVVDTVLYNDPRHGFLINVGEVLGSVVVYGLRRPPGSMVPAPVAAHRHPLLSVGGRQAAAETGAPAAVSTEGLSSAGAALGEFQLSVYEAGAPAPVGPGSTNLLVLYSLNGRKMSAFAGFDELIAAIKGCGDFAWWRFLIFDEVNLRRLPRDCCFASAEEPTTQHSAFAPLAPAMTFTAPVSVGR